MSHITDPSDFLLGVAMGALLGGIIMRRNRQARVVRAAKWILIAGVILLVVAVYMGAPTFMAGWRAGGHH